MPRTTAHLLLALARACSARRLPIRHKSGNIGNIDLNYYIAGALSHTQESQKVYEHDIRSAAVKKFVYERFRNLYEATEIQDVLELIGKTGRESRA